MTVSSAVSNVQYAGNGVTKTFAAPFYFLLNSDIAVQISDVSGNITDLVYGTNYSVTGAGNAGGGSVTLNVAYATGYTILVYRNPPVTQETVYYENGKFPAKSHEKALDKLTMLIQQQGWIFDSLTLKKPTFLAKYYDAKTNRIANLGEPVNTQDATTKGYVDGVDGNLQAQITANFQRSLRVPESSVGPTPSAEARANQLLAFDDAGSPIAVLPQSGSASDVLIRLASHEAGKGGSLVSLVQGGTVQDAINYISVNPTGDSVRDEENKNNALATCELFGADIVFNPGNYMFTTGIDWNAKKYSIKGSGDVVLDFTGMIDGGYALNIKAVPTGSGSIWRACAHQFTGLICQGRAGIHFFKNSQANGFDAPQVQLSHSHVNLFDDHITLGDNEWCCVFRSMNFRANNNGSTRFIVIDKTVNACENQSFDACVFNGSNSGLGIKHIRGTCEFTFGPGTSFDYCHQVLSSVNQTTRAIWRFIGVHFEDDGSVRQFDIDSGTGSFYFELSGCDWAFVTKDGLGNTVIPNSLGAFNSSSSKSIIRLRDNTFPIYDESVDRSGAELFVLNNSAIKSSMDGNVIEQGTNQIFNLMSMANNKALPLSAASLTSPLLSTNGAGTVAYDVSDLPTKRINDLTWLVTGVVSGNMMLPLEPSNIEVNILGNLKRSSTQYYVDVRFFSATNIQLSTISLAIPGAIDSWVHFGQTLRTPRGAAFVRIGWAYASPPLSTDTLRLNSLCVEQY